MPRTGKCPNYANCLLAYRNENIAIADGAPFVCPECKQPLAEEDDDGAHKPMDTSIMMIGGISLFVIIGAAIVFFVVRNSREQQPSRQANMPSFAPAAVATPQSVQGDLTPSSQTTPVADTPTPEPSAMPVATPIPAEAPAATASPSAPVEAGVQAQTPNLDLQDSQNQRVKSDVLKRIDLMPTISAEDKDKLYISVERARQMGKVLTIPFASGRTNLNDSDVGQLRTALAAPALQPLLKDPTCVFVILGFADLKGDEKTNLRISTDRAESVLKTLEHLGVLNVLHAVGMGGSTLFGDEHDAERNRVVEVWAVLP